MLLAECRRALSESPVHWQTVEAAITGGEPLSDRHALARALTRAFGERGTEMMREVHRIGVRGPLRRLRDLYRATPRARSRREARAELTDGYVDLLFAWGFRRAGFEADAAALVDDAARVLPVRDPVHGWLVRALRYRIESALDALAPLPRSLEDEAHAVDPFGISIGRIRSASLILEPVKVSNDERGVPHPSAQPSPPPVQAIRSYLRWIPAPTPAGSMEVLETAPQIATITDSYRTNTWFCLSVVGWMDALIAAMSGRTQRSSTLYTSRDDR